MAKKKIVFKVTDGVMPRKSSDGRSFDLQLPMGVRVSPHSNQTVKLGI
jgi:hypothetical protein